MFTPNELMVMIIFLICLLPFAFLVDSQIDYPWKNTDIKCKKCKKRNACYQAKCDCWEWLN